MSIQGSVISLPTGGRDDAEVSQNGVEDGHDNQDHNHGCKKPEKNSCGKGDDELFKTVKMKDLTLYPFRYF